MFDYILVKDGAFLLYEAIRLKGHSLPGRSLSLLFQMPLIIFYDLAKPNLLYFKYLYLIGYFGFQALFLSLAFFRYRKHNLFSLFIFTSVLALFLNRPTAERLYLYFLFLALPMEVNSFVRILFRACAVFLSPFSFFFMAYEAYLSLLKEVRYPRLETAAIYGLSVFSLFSHFLSGNHYNRLENGFKIIESNPETLIVLIPLSLYLLLPTKHQGKKKAIYFFGLLLLVFNYLFLDNELIISDALYAGKGLTLITILFIFRAMSSKGEILDFNPAKKSVRVVLTLALFLSSLSLYSIYQDQKRIEFIVNQIRDNKAPCIEANTIDKHLKNIFAPIRINFQTPQALGFILFEEHGHNCEDFLKSKDSEFIPLGEALPRDQRVYDNPYVKIRNPLYNPRNQKSL